MAGALNKPGSSPFIPLSEVDPRMFSFSSMVDISKVTPDILGQLIPQETTYRQFSKLPGMDNSRVEEKSAGMTLGDNWVYTHASSGQGFWNFFFVRKRTDQEIETAIPALSYYTVDIYPWPSVLLGLWFVEDATQPYEVVVRGASSSVSRLFPRKKWLEGGSYATLFQVEIFASHKPFDAAFYKLDPPVTTGVYWNTRNTRGDLPACLHDEVVIPEGNPNGAVWAGAGMKNSEINYGEATVFPKTNHTRWKDHVSHEHVQQVGGVYMMERRTAITPIGAPRPSIQ